MATLTQAERALYEDVWSLPEYADHAPGEVYLPAFLACVGDQRGSVLDAGTGSGKGALALNHAGFRVTMCDLTPAGLTDEARALPFVEACLWDDLATIAGRHTWVYCTDVLEHLPTALTALVVRRLLDASTYGVFLSVSLVPDHFGVLVGRALHQTVQPFGWWLELLRELGTVTDARDLGATGLYMVAPRG
jgi:hypothetical protein